jgi:hypothetical protein
MPPLSERLRDLSARTKELEDRDAANRAAARATLESAASGAQINLAKARDDLQSQLDAASDRASASWQQAQASIDAWADEMQRRQAERRTQRDTERVRDAVIRADEDAAAAVDYAIYAVAVAESAMADAVDTRQAAGAASTQA